MEIEIPNRSSTSFAISISDVMTMHMRMMDSAVQSALRE
jgi:hypothetical protein